MKIATPRPQCSVGCGVGTLNCACLNVLWPCDRRFSDTRPGRVMLRWAVAAGSAVRIKPAVIAGCALLAAGPALAQSAPDQDSQDTRFVFHEVDEGILRLDSKLGDISLCSRQPLGWTCRLVAGE